MESNPRTEVTQIELIKQYEVEQKEIEKAAEIQILQQASKIRKAKKLVLP